MKVLIVGSGGREHALGWKLKQSPLVEEVYVAPGNGGSALECVNVAIRDSDMEGLVAFAVEQGIGLVVTGPELPLVLGLGNLLAEKGIPCFGPGAFAAQLEGSKSFAKRIMCEAGVPTAAYQMFDEYEQARNHVESRSAPMVVKADGLAAGKGVIVARTREEALTALREIMVDKVFGEAGDRVVIEDALVGEEASFLAFCDGENVQPLPSSQDHKPVGHGDTGPNTGGMGAYSPAPVLPEKDYQALTELTIRPIVRRMAELGHPFTGMLYAGLMDTAEGWKVLEYNVRLGDPECQPLLMRLKSDLAEVMLACVQGRIQEVEIACRPETSLCVVMAAKGYPATYPKGMVISGIEEAERLGEVKVFHAGTRLEDGIPVTSGGRVLGVTALGADLKAAQTLAYKAVDKITFANSYCRRDIGAKGIGR